MVSEEGGDAGGGAVEDADEVDGEVAEGGHDLGSVAGSGEVVVLVEHDVTDPVEGLDAPVSLDPGGDLAGGGSCHGYGADEVEHFGVSAACLGAGTA